MFKLLRIRLDVGIPIPYILVRAMYIFFLFGKLFQYSDHCINLYFQLTCRCLCFGLLQITIITMVYNTALITHRSHRWTHFHIQFCLKIFILYIMLLNNFVFYKVIESFVEHHKLHRQQ